jgi:mercuric ion binding protein
MKTLLIYLIVLSSLLLPFSVFSAEEQVEIDIQGMTCNLWPLAIKKSLSGVEGVSKVHVSFDKRIGLVTVEGKVPEEVLLEAIKRAGPYSGTIKKGVDVEWNADR